MENSIAEGFAQYQDEDPDLLRIIKRLQNSKSKYKLVTRNIENDILYGVVDEQNTKFRPIVPKLLQPAVFHNFHNTLHQGVEKTINIIRQHYFWPEMSKEIELWVKYCPKCQSCKVIKHNRQALQSFPGDPKRLEILHLDVVGPLYPESGEYKYLLTIRDRGTGFVQLIPLSNKTSASIAKSFKLNWIGIFGVPERVVTDNGREFSSEFDEVCHQLGVVHIRSTSYHPQSNGFIERIHRMLKTALRALEEKEEWVNQIPMITLMLNNQTSDISSFTPYQKSFGKTCRVPGVILTKGTSMEDSEVADNDVNVFCELMSHYQREARPLSSGSQIDEKLIKYV